MIELETTKRSEHLQDPPEALSSPYTLRPEPPKSTTQYQLGMILYRVPARCPPAPSSLTVIGPSSTLIDGLA